MNEFVAKWSRTGTIGCHMMHTRRHQKGIVLEVFLNDAIRNRLIRLGRMVTDSRLKALVINLRH